MIKKMIMKWVEKEIKNSFDAFTEMIDYKIDNTLNSIIEFENLNKLTDKEIIEMFKHQMFYELSHFNRMYLLNRYNLNYQRKPSWGIYDTKWAMPSSYVADTIEKILLLKESKEESNNVDN